MVPPSEHSLDVAEPCLPNARHVDRKTGSWESHGRDKRRKEEVPERQSRKKENRYSELQRGPGASADTS